jgi:hypothetical protein
MQKTPKEGNSDPSWSHSDVLAITACPMEFLFRYWYNGSGLPEPVGGCERADPRFLLGRWSAS